MKKGEDGQYEYENTVVLQGIGESEDDIGEIEGIYGENKRLLQMERCSKNKRNAGVVPSNPNERTYDADDSSLDSDSVDLGFLDSK